MKYFLYRCKYRFARSLNLRAPVDISLELSSYCNAACIYCYHADSDNLPFDKGIMRPSIAKKILLSAKDAGVSSIKTNWRGEPTINPRFYYICKTAKDLGFIDRITNSNFIFNPEKMGIFEGMCCQTKVKVSLDSFINSVYKEQRGCNMLPLVLHNVNKFYNWPKRKTKLVIQAVRTTKNVDEDLEHEVKKRWPSAEVSIRDMVPGRLDSDLTKLENKKLSGERAPCLQAFNRLIFDHKGIAYPCCPDYKGQFPIGNIKCHSINDIFNSRLAQELRTRLKG